MFGLWLGGSRGAGIETEHSDWDVRLLTATDAKSRYAPSSDLRDIRAFDLAELEAYAAWGGPQAWDRYSFTPIQVLIDRDPRLRPILNAKARIPPGAASAFIDARLDHALNQLYRAAKARRDGDDLTARLEMAGGVEPLLDAIFALDGGRLRPYPKYLPWELAQRPLPCRDLLGRLRGMLDGDLASMQSLAGDAVAAACGAGLSAAPDGWDETLDWMTTFTC